MSNCMTLKVKRYAFYILMFAFTLSICFLVLEFIFAKFYYSNLTGVPDKKFDHILGWRLKPGTYWIKPSHTFSKHQLYINNLGLRNRDISATTKKGVKRILILGDSFTYAKAINDKNIFSSLLEEIVSENFGSKYEIINCGVEGYGTAQELLFTRWLTEKGVVGDVYLLMIYTNDILDNLRLGYGNLKKNPVQPGYVLYDNGDLQLKYPPQKRISRSTTNFCNHVLRPGYIL